MPYIIRKIRNQNQYKVYNPITMMVHSKHTTLEKAKAQVRLLESIHNKTRN